MNPKKMLQLCCVTVKNYLLRKPFANRVVESDWL